jgi:endoglucanase
VRGSGADNIVIAGGLIWAETFSGVLPYVLTGTNVVYNVHTYNHGAATPPAGGWAGGWDTNFGFLTASYPVISTEFGSFDCSSEFVSQLIAYFDAHQIGWTSWGWYVGGCTFPSIISSWDGAPAPGMGQTVQQALLGY